MKKTKVINLFAGSGAGKSTLAAGLFHSMKVSGYNVELVTEFVKSMAWENIIPNKYDQPYIFGNQSKNESRLYGKVDYVITDSPLLLGPVYEKHYNGHSITEPAVEKFLAVAYSTGIEHLNFLLERSGAFDVAGRFETEEQSKHIDNLIEDKLISLKLPYIILNRSNQDKINYILSRI